MPQQFQKELDLPNRSYLTTSIGLAFRKLDVFGYYKFVTAAKNINLLPNRKSMFKQKKMKAKNLSTVYVFPSFGDKCEGSGSQHCIRSPLYS